MKGVAPFWSTDYFVGLMLHSGSTNNQMKYFEMVITVYRANGSTLKFLQHFEEFYDSFLCKSELLQVRSSWFSLHQGKFFNTEKRKNYFFQQASTLVFRISVQARISVQGGILTKIKKRTG